MVLYIIFLLLVILLFIIRCIYNYLYNDPVVVFIDGNIGAGKSTFIKMMELQFHKYYYVTEPINMWKGVVDDQNISLFGNFYKNKERWSYTFQNMVQMTKFYDYVVRLDKIKEHSFISRILFGTKIVVIIERSCLIDKNAFASLLHDNEYIDETEWKIYNMWYDLINKTIQTKNIIYLQTSPNICLDRIHVRDRDEENTITIEYLIELHNRHDNVLLNNKNINVLKLNNDYDILNKASILSYQFNKINNFISSL